MKVSPLGKGQWFNDALRHLVPTAQHVATPILTPWALLWGHHDKRISAVEDLYFYGPQLTSLLLAVIACNVAFHVVVASVLPAGDARNISFIALACGVLSIVGISVGERLLLKHHLESCITCKKVWLALWMLGVICWSTLGPPQSDIDSCFQQPAASCRRIPSLEAPSFLVVFAWMRLAHPRWLILQALIGLAVMGSSRTFIGATSSSASQSIVGQVFYCVFELMAAVSWWLIFRPAFEVVLALRRTDKALQDARGQVATSLSRLVPDVTSCESIVWHRHWTARATGDSLLMLCHARNTADAAQSPTDAWAWRDALATHFGECWATNTAVNSIGARPSKQQPTRSLVCSVGDALYCVLECPENESVLQKELKGFLKHVLRFHGGLQRLNALQGTKVVLHRGFVTCVCVGTRSMAPILLGSGSVEAVKALHYAPTESICGTSTFVPMARLCGGWSCSEPIATFSTPLNELALTLMVLHAATTDVAQLRVDTAAPADDAPKKGKGERKAVTIVVSAEGTPGDAAAAGDPVIDSFLQLAHRHPSARLQSRTGLSRRAALFSYDELNNAAASLTVPNVFHGAHGDLLQTKWAFIENSFSRDCAYICFTERILALIVCVASACGLAVLSILHVDFSAPRSTSRVGMTLASAALDFATLFSSLHRTPSRKLTLIAATLHVASSVCCFISFVLLNDVNASPTLQILFTLRMVCFVHGLPQLGVRLLLLVVLIGMIVPTVVYGVVFSVDRVGVTIGFMICSVLVVMDAFSHESGVRLALLHTHLTAAAAEEASELIAVMRACLASVMGRTLSEEVVRQTLPIRRCRRFDSAIVLAVTLTCPLQNRTPCRQNPILGITERHSMRLLLDDVAQAHGVELLTTCVGDIVCYVDYFGNLSGPQLNTRRVKGKFLPRKSIPSLGTDTKSESSPTSPSDVVVSNARFMAELWATMLVAIRSWGGPVDGASIGLRPPAAGGASLSQPWSHSSASVSSPSANGTSIANQVTLSAALDTGVVCVGVSAVGSSVLSLTASGAPLFEATRLVSRAASTANDLRIPLALSHLVLPEINAQHRMVTFFASSARVRTPPPHVSLRTPRSGSIPNAMGLVEVPCEVNSEHDCTMVLAC